MKHHVAIHPPARPVSVSIQLPNSKSISNRVLVMAALCGERHKLSALAASDDTLRLDRALNEEQTTIDCGDGGTTLRFALAWAAIQKGEERLITGGKRLLERPHDPLIEALRSLGAEIRKSPEGFQVTGKELNGGEVEFRSPVSSQYISALLMIAPYMSDGLRIHWKGDRLSGPYVRMTLGLMRHFGATVKMDDDVIEVEAGGYSPVNFIVPCDWSAAAFWYEIVAIIPGSRVLLIGLFDDGIQGDVAARRLWDRWVITEQNNEGTFLRHRSDTLSTTGLEFELQDTPDLFQPLALTCAARGADAIFTGLDNLPLKETDRLAATARILQQLGAESGYHEGTFKLPAWDLVPSSAHDLPVLDPDGDHRMAMSIAPLAGLISGLRIADPYVVRKSYPAYWDHLQLAGFKVEQAVTSG